MFPLFTTRCLHVRHDARDPSGGSGNCGRECCLVILPKWRLPRHLGIFYMPQIYDMGPTALFPVRRKACWGFFFALKNPTASAGFEPANLGTKGQHASPRTSVSQKLNKSFTIYSVFEIYQNVSALWWHCVNSTPGTLRKILLAKVISMESYMKRVT